MDIFKKLTQEFIDIIEWVDNSNNTLVWKFPRYQNEIKYGAQLTVRESQIAIFLNEGKIADIYQSGRHELTTANMPILTTLKGWKYGFNSPFKVDVFFVSTKQFIDMKWGTKNPIIINDDRFGMIEMRAFGNYAFKITDAPKFFTEIAGTKELYTKEDIQEHLRTIIVAKLTDAIGESKIKIEEFASSNEEFSAFSIAKLSKSFLEYGLEITQLNVENISMPEEIKKEIFELSRLGKINIQQLTQLKVAKGIEKAAESGGTASAFVGVGMGNIISGAMQNPTTNQAVPPPLLQIFVAINGQQSGPFDMPQLIELAQKGSLTKESLVWKSGLSEWIPAQELDVLNSVFNQVPPPLS